MIQITSVGLISSFHTRTVETSKTKGFSFFPLVDTRYSTINVPHLGGAHVPLDSTQLAIQHENLLNEFYSPSTFSNRYSIDELRLEIPKSLPKVKATTNIHKRKRVEEPIMSHDDESDSPTIDFPHISSEEERNSFTISTKLREQLTKIKLSNSPTSKKLKKLFIEDEEESSN